MIGSAIALKNEVHIFPSEYLPTTPQSFITYEKEAITHISVRHYTPTRHITYIPFFQSLGPHTLSDVIR